MNFSIERILYSMPAVIIGLSVHEFSHAFMAMNLGDSTAKDEGRVSLNPLRHLDPLGFLFIVLVGFGWAKPVRFNPENLKHKKRDRILIALAGPLSNLALGTAALLVLKLLVTHIQVSDGSLADIGLNLLLYFGYINFGLFVFNMIPLPPLDGSHVLLQGINLSPAIEQRVVQYGSYALFAIILAENRLNIDLLPIGRAVNTLVGLFF
ncbi:MAG TPA: site-2 protease family protein [Spirochaetaceae bacterium]|nr:site-2 protease family protein [Spirochaetaceae bacterium]